MVSAINICHWPEIDLTYLLCELLVHRNYRHDVPDAHWLVARFAKLYLELPKHKRTPFLYDDGVTYTTYWGRNDIFLLAVSRSNVNAMLAVALLHQMHQIMELFFLHQQGQAISSDAADKPVQQISQAFFTRESVLDNNAFVYELLDECVDFGVVQITDYNILKEYIKMRINVGKGDRLAINAGSDSDSDSGSDSGAAHTKHSNATKKNKHGRLKLQTIKSTHNQAVRTDVESKAADKLINSSIVRTQVSPVSWRLKGIFYSKNEIYIDIIETCDFSYDLETATVKSNQILGVCMVRSYLSGMPVCKLGLNEERLSQVEYDGESGDGSAEEEGGNQLLVEEIDEDDEDDEDAELERKEKDEKDEYEKKVVGLTEERGQDKRRTEKYSTDFAITEDDTPKEHLKKRNKKKKKHKVPLTNVQFHLCVELSTIYKSNLIRFTPPDDKFQLFSFRVEQQRHKQMTPLLLIDPKYRILKEQRRLQIMCTIKTNFRKKLHCRKLVVRIPLHASLFPLQNADQDSFRFRSELGDVRFRVDTSEILWTIADLPGSKKVVRMMAEVNLSNTEYSLKAIPHIFKGAFSTSSIMEIGKEMTEDAVTITNPKDLLESAEAEAAAADAALDELDRFYHVNGVSSSLFAQLQRLANDVLFNDISLEFEIPMLAYSGLRVTYIRVDEESLKYTCFPWVRYVTRSNAENRENSNQGRYCFRLGPSNFTLE